MNGYLQYFIFKCVHGLFIKDVPFFQKNATIKWFFENFPHCRILLHEHLNPLTCERGGKKDSEMDHDAYST